MEPKNDSILTEDGQRLVIREGEIIGTEDTGPGLAFESAPLLPGDEYKTTESPGSEESNKNEGGCTTRKGDSGE